MVDKKVDQIAVISTAFRLPGISNYVDLVDTVYHAKTQYKALSDDFWLQRSGSRCANPSYAATISDIDLFPAEYFGVTPREVPTIDPLQRLVLLGVRDLLESVSFHQRYDRYLDVGVYIGASGSEYRQCFLNLPVKDSLYATTGTANSVIAGRVSYHYNFTGPSLVVDTACSSSLVAVSLAAKALQSGCCGFAIAGGINLLISPRTHEEYSLMGMTSKAGRNATFSDVADGYVRSEGYGFLLLRPLSDALSAGDHILGVISSSVINQDGTTNGITAPSGPSQVSLIKASLQQACLSPADLSYHECHGTATRLGDLIELRSLSAVFGEKCRLPIGSFKANIGHLEVAAGIAGFIKALLILRIGRIPPHPLIEKPNQSFNWESGHGLVLPTCVEELSQDSDGLSHIGISSFGFSGTNCHIIVSNHEPVAGSDQHLPGAKYPGFFLLSSPTRNLLDQYLARTREYYTAFPCLSHDLSQATLASREQFDVQSYVDVNASCDYHSLIHSIADLDSLADGLVFIFDGQGSYHPNLGKTVYTQSGRTKCVLDHCFLILGDLQYPYTELIIDHLTSARQQPTTQLPPPAQQIVIAIVEYAIAVELLSAGVKPTTVIGHSLGEYVAAVIAGRISLEYCLAVLSHRSLLIEETGQLGGLVAVNISAEELARTSLPHHSQLAIINSESSVVLAYRTQDQQTLIAQLQDIGRFKDLGLTVPYHSDYLSELANRLSEFNYPHSCESSICDFISCMTGSVNLSPLNIDYWSLQLRSTVLFSEAVRFAVSTQPQCIIEISPRPILSRHIQDVISDSSILFLTTEEHSDAFFSTFATRVLDSLSESGLIKKGQIFSQSSVEAPDPLVPVTGLGGEHYWVNAPNPASSHATNAVTATSASLEAQPDDHRSASIPSNGSLSLLRVSEIFAQICSISLDRIDLAKPFQRYGADSLLLSQFATQLSKKFGISVAVVELFGRLNTIEKLVAYGESIISHNSVEANSNQNGSSDHSHHPNLSCDPQPVLSLTSSKARGAKTQPWGTASGSSDDPRYQQYVHALAQSLSQKLSNSKNVRSSSSLQLADSRAIAGYDPDFHEFQFPLIGESGHGASIVDVDGNRYVDLTMGFGVQLFGHHPAFIDDAIREQLTKGIHLGPQARLASKVAMLISEITGKERIAFCNSGTEAVMTSLRIARACSGKSLVAQFIGAYHGHFDPTLCISDTSGLSLPLSPGTPADYTNNTLLLDYSSSEQTLIKLNQHKESLAAVLVEPVQSRNPSVQSFELLAQIEKFCNANQILLIFDEVLTGFRVSQSGVQGLLGIKPHLTCYGKIVGGGLPIGVIAGDSFAMDYLDKGAWIPGQSVPSDTISSIFFAGTFNKNPLVMATAEAVLLQLRQSNGKLQQSLNSATDEFISNLNSSLRALTKDVRVDHYSSFFRFIGFPSIFYYALLDKGVYVWEGRTCFLSTAHTQRDLTIIHDAVIEVTNDLIGIGVLSSVSSGSALVSTPTVEQASPYRLTSVQVEMLASYMLDLGSSHRYNQSILFRIPNSIDIANLLAAINQSIRIHPELYTSYDIESGFATVLSPFTLSLNIASSLDDALSFQFSPFTGRNVRATLLADNQCNDSTLELLLVFPHFSVDGWSLQVIATSIAKYYDEPCKPRITFEAASSIRFREYSQLAYSDIIGSSSLHYWSQKLANTTTTLHFPNNFGSQDSRVESPKAFFSSLELDSTHLRSLVQGSEELGVSPYILLLSAFVQTILKFSGQDDFTIATICSGQLTSGMLSLVGNCTTILPLRFSRQSNAAKLVATVDATFTEALRHSHFDLRQVLNKLGVKPNQFGHALSNVCFNYDVLQPSTSSLTDTIQYNPHRDHDPKWDLFLNVINSGDSLELSLEANLESIPQSLADRILPTYVDSLSDLVTQLHHQDPPGHSTLSGAEHLSVSPPSAALNTLYHDRIAGYLNSHWLLSRLKDQLRATDRLALVSSTRSLCYSELYQHIISLAGEIIRHCGDNTVISIVTADSSEAVLLMLSCWASGHAALHLSANDPAAWILSRIQEANSNHILTDNLALSTYSSTSIQLSDSLYLIKLDTGAEQVTSRASDKTIADDAAYLLCTSGTTGKPKLPVISHDAIRNYTISISRYLGISKSDNSCLSFGLLTPLSSDLGYTMIFPALYFGHTLRCFSYAESRDGALLSDSLQQRNVDFLKVVPSHFMALLDSGLSRSLLPNHSIVFGGDFLPHHLVADIFNSKPDINVFNHYGPSEATVGVCCMRITAADIRTAQHPIPVGQPFPGVTINIEPLPDQLVLSVDVSEGNSKQGEIVILGNTLMLGYSDQLLDSQHSTRDALGAYRTGDLGYYDENGSLCILGRLSQLVKIKGYRVSIPFLESQLRKLAFFSEFVVVTVQDSESSESELVCLACSSNTQDLASIRADLSQQLPSYYLPKSYCFVESIPKLASGKPDRRACVEIVTKLLRVKTQPNACLKHGSVDSASSTGNAAWSQFVAFLTQILRADPNEILPSSSFIELGGDSIDAIRLSSLLRKSCFSISPVQILGAESIHDLFSLLSLQSNAADQPISVPSHANRGELCLTPGQSSILALNSSQLDHWGLACLVRIPQFLTDDEISKQIHAIVLDSPSLQYSLVDGVLRLTRDASAHAYLSSGHIHFDSEPDILSADFRLPIETTSDLASELSLGVSKYLAWSRVSLTGNDAETYIIVCAHHFFFDIVSLQSFVSRLYPLSTSDAASLDTDTLEDSMASLYSAVSEHSAGISSYLTSLRQVPPLSFSVPSGGFVTSSFSSIDLRLPISNSYSVLGSLRFGCLPGFLFCLHDVLSTVNGGDQFLIDIETHGRPVDHQSINTYDIFSLFTCHTPFVLKSKQTSGSIPGYIVSCDQDLASLVNIAIPYNALHSRGFYPPCQEPVISVNYVSHSVRREDNIASIVAFDTGVLGSASFLRSFPFQFVLVENAAELHVRFDYVPDLLTSAGFSIASLTEQLRHTWTALMKASSPSKDDQAIVTDSCLDDNDDLEDEILSRLFS